MGKEFYENMDVIILGIPIGEKLIRGGDLNGHIGRNSHTWERAQGGVGMVLGPKEGGRFKLGNLVWFSYSKLVFQQEGEALTHIAKAD